MLDRLRPIALAFLIALPVQAGELSGPAQAVDGASLEIAGATLRLHGVDAPKPGQRCARAGGDFDCGQESGWALADRIGRHWVRCVERGREETGRVIAACTIGADIDVNAHMVASGWAQARRDEEPGYGPLEDAARLARRGIWQGR